MFAYIYAGGPDLHWYKKYARGNASALASSHPPYLLRVWSQDGITHKVRIMQQNGWFMPFLRQPYEYLY